MAAQTQTLLSLQSLLHVSSYVGSSKKKHIASSEKSKNKNIKQEEGVDLLVEGVAIQQPQAEPQLSASETDELVSLARMFSEEGNFQGTCLHVDEDQFMDGMDSINNSPCEEEDEEEDKYESPPLRELRPLERLQQAHVFPLSEEVVESAISTSVVSGVIESGLLVGDLDKAATANLIDINSGGELYFIFFTNPTYFNGEIERACVIKFAPSRMSTQGEALAYEIALSVGAPSPPARIIREDSLIWDTLLNGSKNIIASENEGLVPEDPLAADEVEAEEGETEPPLRCSLVQCLENSKCALLIELVNGPPLARATTEFIKHNYSLQVAANMGSLFALDMILGNPDRLSCRALGWRGNNNNSRWDTSGLRVVGIDHTLARRPPRMLKCTPKTVSGVTAAIFGVDDPMEGSVSNGVGIIEDALSSVFGDLTMSDEEKTNLANSFKDGIRATFDRSEQRRLVSTLEELKQMEVFLSVNLGKLFASLRTAVGVSDDCDFNSTKDLRSLQRRAAENDDVRIVFKDAQEVLAVAVLEYINSLPSPPPGAMSFLEATAESTAVNCYELRTRLRHIIPRFEALENVLRPIQGE